MFTLQSGPVDTVNARQQLIHPGCGGYCSFEGWVRDHHEGRSVDKLIYEAYAPLALREGQTVIDEAVQRFEIEAARCVHRTGELAVGELAVWVGVAAAHRDAAFAASRYIIDEIKTRVPIWKNEFYTDGTSAWVNCAACAATADDNQSRRAV